MIQEGVQFVFCNSVSAAVTRSNKMMRRMLMMMVMMMTVMVITMMMTITLMIQEGFQFVLVQC